MIKWYYIFMIVLVVGSGVFMMADSYFSSQVKLECIRMRGTWTENRWNSNGECTFPR